MIPINIIKTCFSQEQFGIFDSDLKTHLRNRVFMHDQDGHHTHIW